MKTRIVNQRIQQPQQNNSSQSIHRLWHMLYFPPAGSQKLQVSLNKKIDGPQLQ